MQRHPAFLLVQAIEAEEREHTRKTGERREFYHPGYSANGSLLSDGTFKPSGVPGGFVLDVEAWEEAGQRGPAALKPAPQDPPGEPEVPFSRPRDERGRFVSYKDGPEELTHE